MRGQPSNGRRTTLRRIAPGVVLIAFVIGVLGGWLLLSASSSRASASPWYFANEPKLAQTTTVFTVMVYPPACVNDNVIGPWFPTPAVTYTPSSVTVTMRRPDSFDPKKCWPCDDPTVLCAVGVHPHGSYAEVQLSEPLMGRALFDGSTSPPAARPYASP